MDCDEPSHTSLSSPPRLRYFAATQRRVGNSACPEPNTAPSVRAARLGDQTCNPCRVCLRAISLVAPAAPAAPAMQGGAGRAGVIELLRMSCSIATDLPRPHRQTTLQGGRGCAGAGTPPTHPLPTHTPRRVPRPAPPLQPQAPPRRHRPLPTKQLWPSSGSACAVPTTRTREPHSRPGKPPCTPHLGVQRTRHQRNGLQRSKRAPS